MNRIDELTDRLIDGNLAEPEAVELDSLLSSDPDAQARHLAALRLELVLREQRSDFDLAGRTVAKIEADRVTRTTTAVMAQLADQPRPGRTHWTLRRRALMAALAAAVLLATWFGGRDVEPVPGPTPTVIPEFARLTSVSSSVEIVDAAGVATAAADQSIAPDQTLHTVGEESIAIVEFPDHTRLEVHPESIVRFERESAGDHGRKLSLIQGRISVMATERIVVGTGATEVEARLGSFSLASAGSGSARVESTTGDVRVRRGAPEDPMVLGPGRAAFVRDEESPVRIETPWQIDSEPRASLDFAALDVRFTANGDIIAASAKQWVRWAPGSPDPGRMLFLPKVFNDGHGAKLTPDHRTAALCRVDDRVDGIQIRELPTGLERGRIPVRVSEPRFFCLAPDASWVATAGGPKLENRRVRLWNVAGAQERLAFDLDNPVTCLTSSPDSRWLANGVTDLSKASGNLVVMLDATTGQRLFELRTQRKVITTLAFSDDGKHLAVGSNGAVQVWDVTARKLLRTLEGFERSVTCLAFSPQADLLAVGTQDGQVWVWSTSTGQRTQMIDTGTRGVRSLGFSPNGKRLVTATNRAPVAVWDVKPEAAVLPTPKT